MPTLTKEARGQFVYSMLDGDALTAVERLEFAEFAIDGGENWIVNMLEARKPDKDPIDRAGKALFDMFEVSAKEGERLSEWSARAESVFHACQRDAGIAFSNMVKGYLCLHRCGLSDMYEIASIAPALRSCFPEYRVPKMAWKTCTLDEDEVQEVLATAWKQKRQQISKERFRRGFGKPSKPTATSATRFLLEVEVLKLRTKCNRCEHVGHWVREVSAKIVARSQRR